MENVLKEYENIIDSIKFVNEGKNSPNLRDFKTQKNI